jgi:hypothetical protein
VVHIPLTANTSASPDRSAEVVLSALPLRCSEWCLPGKATVAWMRYAAGLHRDDPGRLPASGRPVRTRGDNLAAGVNAQCPRVFADNDGNSIVVWNRDARVIQATVHAPH